MRLREEQGFTLVELLVTLIVGGILLGSLAGTFAGTLRWGGDVQERSVLQTEARTATDQLAADLRQAYTGDATPLVLTSDPSSLTFYSPDRAVPMRLRRIAYRLSGGELQRSVTTSTNVGAAPWTFPVTAGPWIRQVGSVTNSILFTYADINGVATTTPARVKTVAITLSVATRAAAGRASTFTTSVAIRGAR